MFHHKSFQPASFSVRAFKMALGDEVSASSGIRRLWLYKLQEAELEKRKSAEVKSEVVEVIDEQKQEKTTKKRARKRPSREIRLVEYPEIEFKRKPIYSRPIPIDETFPLWVSVISTEVESWLVQYATKWCVPKTVKSQNTHDVAANDAEFRRRLLLLAA